LSPDQQGLWKYYYLETLLIDYLTKKTGVRGATFTFSTLIFVKKIAKIIFSIFCNAISAPAIELGIDLIKNLKYS